MNMLTLNPHPVQTMSSREIADLVAKRHDNVKRTIESLSEQCVIQLPQFEEVKNHLGQSVMQYVFEGEKGRRDSIVVVAQLCPEYTAKIVDRWQELEARVMQPFALPNFTDPAEAAVAWAAEFKAKQLAQVQVTQLETKVTEMTVDVQAFNQLTKADGSLCITDAAKSLSKGQKELHRWLNANDWIYKRAGNAHWLGYSEKEKSGYVEHKVTEVTRGDGSTKIVEQVRITPKGLAKLAKIFAAGDAA